MKNILHKQIAALITSIVVLIAVLATIFLFLRTMQQKTARVVAVKEQLASYNENKKIFSEEAKELQALSDHAKTLAVYRITPATTPDLLTRLEALANAGNVTFDITSVETPDAGTPNAKLLIEFSAKGSTTAIDAFLESLQHQSYQVQLLHFALHRDMTIAPILDTTNKDLKAKPLPIPVTVWELGASIQITSY